MLYSLLFHNVGSPPYFRWRFLSCLLGIVPFAVHASIVQRRSYLPRVFLPVASGAEAVTTIYAWCAFYTLKPRSFLFICYLIRRFFYLLLFALIQARCLP